MALQLVEIRGPEEVLKTLLGVEGLVLSFNSAAPRDDDLWRISGYATDEAVEELERRGCTIVPIMSSAEVDAAIARGSRRPGAGRR